MATETNPNAQVTQFLANRKALVADAGSSSRNSIRKLFTDLGMISTSVFGSDGFTEARDIIIRHKPTVLVLSDQLGDGDGAKLLDVFRKETSHLPHDRLILFLANEGLSSVTAQAAASLEVDALIVRPFTLERIYAELRRLVVLKALPPAYSTLIGRALVDARESRWDAVLTAALEAQKLHPKPTDGLVLEARARLKTGALKEGVAALQRSLGLVPDHLPSVAMLTTIQLALKNDAAALPLVLQLKASSAIAPPLIPAVLRMAGELGRFELIEEIELKVDSLPRGERTEAIQKELASSAIKLALHKLSIQTDKPEDRVKTALEWFKRAIRTGGGGLEIHLETFRAMAQANLFAEIELIVASAPPEVRDSPESKLLYLEFLDRSGDVVNTLRVADDLRKQKISAPRLYELMIRRSLEVKRPARIIRNLVEEACEKNPDRANDFRAMVPADVLKEPR